MKNEFKTRMLTVYLEKLLHDFDLFYDESDEHDDIYQCLEECLEDLHEANVDMIIKTVMVFSKKAEFFMIDAKRDLSPANMFNRKRV